MTLPCEDSAFFEAVQPGVGLVHYRADLILGFEDYAFCLVCHFTLS